LTKNKVQGNHFKPEKKYSPNLKKKLHSWTKKITKYASEGNFTLKLCGKNSVPNFERQL
jgi:hypothetical protein